MNRPEPALLDSALPVDWSRPDLTGASMSYWPSYSSITPQARAAHLLWLAGGRSAPGAFIGYVFLFFYGLERRVLHDLVATPDHPELAVIGGEIRRLLSLYGGNGSFRSYATSLLGFLSAGSVAEKLYEQAPPVSLDGGELPLAFRAGLGQLARDQAPLPWTWALAWHRMTSPARAAVERCPDEFNELFRMRHEQRHGAGLMLRAGRSRLRVEHHPASPGLRERTFTRELGLPDVASLSTPLRQVHELGERCCEELAPYARALRRNPEAAGTLVALALLPEGLDAMPAGDVGQRLDGLLQRVQSSGGRAVVIDAEELLALWPAAEPGRLRKAEAVQLSQLLARSGVGLVPDIRFGGKPPCQGMRAALFALGTERLDAPTPGLDAAVLLLSLMSLVASADGEVSPSEERGLAAHVEEGLHLGPAERARLRAHLDLLIADPPKLTGWGKHVASLEQPQRQAIGRFLIQAAAADGRIEASEMKVLAKVYRLLELDPGTIHSEIHAVSTGVPAAAPVVVRAAQPSPGRSIRQPRPDAAPEVGLRLDAVSVDAKMKETLRVSALLSKVLADDATEGTSAPLWSATAGSAATGHAGLTPAQAQLVVVLCERDQWPWEEVRSLAERFGLLADGALERINEVALQRLDAPACESGDPLWVDQRVMRGLFS